MLFQSVVMIVRYGCIDRVLSVKFLSFEIIPFNGFGSVSAFDPGLMTFVCGGGEVAETVQLETFKPNRLLSRRVKLDRLIL